MSNNYSARREWNARNARRANAPFENIFARASLVEILLNEDDPMVVAKAARELEDVLRLAYELTLVMPTNDTRQFPLSEGHIKLINELQARVVGALSKGTQP